MRSSFGHSGAYVADAKTGKALFDWSATTRRVLGSNTKLFTVGTALGLRGPNGKIPTKVLISGQLDDQGGLKGNLYLLGGGDPTFASSDYARFRYGSAKGGTVEGLARRLRIAGLKVVSGAVVGDESTFDSRRSGPAEGYRSFGEVVGPLSALVYNHGLTATGARQSDPPSYVAARLTDALREQGVTVRKSARSGTAPSGAVELARVNSLPMSRIAFLTLTPSDAFFADILAKVVGGGTTAGGGRAIVRFARTRGAKVRIVDGSGLSHYNQAAPREVVKYLLGERAGPESKALYHAMAITGVSGTLAHRMTSGPAHGRCRAKTGTLYNVSVLSGYCKSRGGHTLVFSILMNGVNNIPRARALQDQMAQSIADYSG